MKKIFLAFIFMIFLTGFVFSVGESSYCCEKTIDGAMCQNAPIEKCDDAFRKVPASCEATSYCRLGCCYNSQEGSCLPNTPQKVCEDENGVWEEDANCDIPQCNLGCCLIGDQAAFVTQTRCKRLSALYGLEINFRTDITNEMTCIMSATSDVKGACVFELEFEKTCEFVSKKECLEKGSGGLKVEFHEGYLCSADSLGTNCGPTKKTRCVEGKDEVYFVDSCGNLANIYDSSKINNKEYWAKVYEKSESCNAGSSNADSATCGNCNYFLGSTCKKYKVGIDKVKQNYGDNICRDLSCEYEGKTYQHGETWCVSPGVDKPGSRYFRLVCYNNEVSVEPCADFRNEICIQSNINGFSTAACRVNKWQDCNSMTKQKDCENSDKRDCKWIGGEENSTQCIPLYSPGFNFWEADGDGESICAQANTQCVVKYEENPGLFGIGAEDKKCIENCHCLKESWKTEMNKICSSLGDCGSKQNYIGVDGYK